MIPPWVKARLRRKHPFFRRPFEGLFAEAAIAGLLDPLGQFCQKIARIAASPAAEGI
jgi:hypothetical protein